QQVVRLEVPGSPEPSRSGEVEVTFWDRLGKEEEEPVAEATGEPEATPTETTVRVAPPGATAVPAPSAAPTAAPVAVAPTEPAAEPTPPSALRGTYQVQVQALADRSGAERLSRQLRAKGYDTDISAAKVSGQTLYRVRVGSFATENDAREVVAKLRREGYAGAFLAAGGSE
ncbi:MAG: SPOR domain-containing protein, partial [Candidatus Binatia bacterium]